MIHQDNRLFSSSNSLNLNTSIGKHFPCIYLFSTGYIKEMKFLDQMILYREIDRYPLNIKLFQNTYFICTYDVYVIKLLTKYIIYVICIHYQNALKCIIYILV